MGGDFSFGRRGACLAMLTGWLASWVVLAGSTAQSQQPARTANTTARPRAAAGGAAATPQTPPVLLSASFAKECRVAVGDAFPTIELPALGEAAEPAGLDRFAGKQATVVLFWSPESWMSRVAVRDFALDLAPTAAANGLGVVGIAVGPDAEAIQAVADTAEARFPQLHDADGAALGQVGVSRMPRVYVLDAERNIVWFDVEYSETTRRELRQTLEALAGQR